MLVDVLYTLLSQSLTLPGKVDNLLNVMSLPDKV